MVYGWHHTTCSPLVCRHYPRIVRTMSLIFVVVLNNVYLNRVSDVTAIWNSNAFWAYVIAVKFQHSTWEPRRLAAVIAASIGVLCVVYGAKGLPSSPSEDGLKAPLVGNLLTLVASLGYGFYQVAYNLYAVPPSESELDLEHDNWQRLPTSSDGVNGQSTDERQTEGATLVANATVPSPPIGLYANALTCGIGIMTLLVLWIPIPVLHFMSIEPFKRPQDLRTVISIAGITISGLTFNATFMVWHSLSSYTFQIYCLMFCSSDTLGCLGTHYYFSREPLDNRPSLDF